MPRGGGRGKKNYKGQRRHFTDEDELARQMKEEEKKREWRKKQGLSDEEAGASKGADGSGSGSDSDSESSSDEDSKPKGVSHLIAIENPNRIKKQAKKVTELDTGDAGAKPSLSRREREELEKQQARVRYQELHQQGKTEEAQADLARLAIIRKKREDAAKKREEEKKIKDAAAAKSKS
ncbi:28 kDa heat- and acid-stable phosphoprotein-like [Liolophura sinensis]|uniref:28 kDa heat- and acid-stable phosphoprotein-like n=1 Tax=Liolophura sinensis TaxID=3198878 RepID=UPI003158EF26